MLLSGIVWPVLSALVDYRFRNIPGTHPTILSIRLSCGYIVGMALVYSALFFEWVTSPFVRNAGLTKTLSDMAWLNLEPVVFPLASQHMVVCYQIVVEMRPKHALAPWMVWVALFCTLSLGPCIGPLQTMPVNRHVALIRSWVPQVVLSLQIWIIAVYGYRKLGGLRRLVEMDELSGGEFW